MKTMFAVTVILSACLLFVGCYSTDAGGAGVSGRNPDSQPLVKDDTGSIVHQPSKTVFPQNMGSFFIVSTRIYDAEGLDVSIGYNPMKGRMGVITVYVYPASDFSTEFETVKMAISVGNSAATFVSESDAFLQGVQGRSAAFDFPADFSGARKDYISCVYLFQTGGWFVKFRVTYEKENAAAFEKELETFFSIFRFPARDRSTGLDIK